MTEKEKAAQGLLYDANYDEHLKKNVWNVLKNVLTTTIYALATKKNAEHFYTPF